ncbi:MAG: hypothetical protein ACE5Q3_11955 [Alphaproteobacteria bacterium]
MTPDPRHFELRVPITGTKGHLVPRATAGIDDRAICGISCRFARPRTTEPICQRCLEAYDRDFAAALKAPT